MEYKCAGIVLHNPDIKRLNINFKLISKQVNHIVLIDNNSQNFKKINSNFKNNSKVKIIKNKENLGVAKALNQICSKAIELGYHWVYLLDQDSISSPTIIKSYSEYINHKKVALLTPYIIDTNKMSIKKYRNLKMPDISEVEWAITAGSLVNLKIWNKIGKFDESLFIDSVDIDYSIRLKLNNYKQLRINSEYILQEVGNAEPTILYRPHKDNSGKWSWKRYYRSNHSPLRQYYMIRNNIIITRRYSKYKSMLKGFLLIFIITFPKLIFEKDKKELIKSIFNGIFDGIKKEVKKYKVE